MTGPWKLNQTPALKLTDSLFPVEPSNESDLDEKVKQDIARGDDGNYPHIASPDVIIDESLQQIRLYYHGRLADGTQVTRVATSTDGIHFTALPEILGLPYFRVFRQEEYYYAMAMPGVLYRSLDGLSDFEAGPRTTNQTIRHHVFLKHGDSWIVFWTRVGDAPESILCSVLLTKGDWLNWQPDQEEKIHGPEKSWEGADQPVTSSRYGTATQPVNQLRDPAIYTENNRIYLLYSIAGEQGLANGEITPEACD